MNLPFQGSQQGQGSARMSGNGQYNQRKERQGSASMTPPRNRRKTRTEELEEQVAQLREHVRASEPCSEDAFMVTKVRKIARDYLFSQIKWIHDTALLDAYDEPGTIGEFVMSKLNIDASEQKRFWDTYKRHVYSAHTEQRNNVTTYAKRAWQGESMFFGQRLMTRFGRTVLTSPYISLNFPQMA